MRKQKPRGSFRTGFLAERACIWCWLDSSIYRSIDPSIDPSIHPSIYPYIHAYINFSCLMLNTQESFCKAEKSPRELQRHWPFKKKKERHHLTAYVTPAVSGYVVSGRLETLLSLEITEKLMVNSMFGQRKEEHADLTNVTGIS
jgi:hypothetical protein